ncbi:MAG: DUF2058 domain-containing protein [Gammaproteobacteria bacterium]|nr:DUF2058 domain-containing protein [Gammaproteobacteria bacterium]
MNNPFQEQLLKAGLVTKQQVQKANQSKHKNKKKQKQRSKKEKAVDETALNARKVAKEKADLDRELNRKKEEDARNKAISIEINQLIENNLVKRGEDCELVYNFEHMGKVKRIYINDKLKVQVMDGRLGIARIEGRYELVPEAVAKKIQQRNEKRIILFDSKDQVVDENDPYADYQIPDDLKW